MLLQLSRKLGWNLVKIYFPCSNFALALAVSQPYFEPVNKLACYSTGFKEALERILRGSIFYLAPVMPSGMISADPDSRRDTPGLLWRRMRFFSGLRRVPRLLISMIMRFSLLIVPIAILVYPTSPVFSLIHDGVACGPAQENILLSSWKYDTNLFHSRSGP